MDRRALPVVFACAMALVAVAFVPSGALASRHVKAQSTKTSLLGGVNIAGLEFGTTGAQIDRIVATAHSVKAKVVRVDVPWAAMEPRGPGQVDARALAFTDRLTSDAAAAGIGVIMMVESTPCWASSAPPSILAHCTRNAGPATSKAGLCATSTSRRAYSVIHFPT